MLRVPLGLPPRNPKHPYLHCTGAYGRFRAPFGLFAFTGKIAYWPGSGRRRTLVGRRFWEDVCLGAKWRPAHGTRRHPSDCCRSQGSICGILSPLGDSFLGIYHECVRGDHTGIAVVSEQGGQMTAFSQLAEDLFGRESYPGQFGRLHSPT